VGGGALEPATAPTDPVTESVTALTDPVTALTADASESVGVSK
jgi:hypothetical protein